MPWMVILAVFLTAGAIVVNVGAVRTVRERRPWSIPSIEGMAYGLYGGWWTTGIVALAWWGAGVGVVLNALIAIAVFALPPLFGSNPKVLRWQDRAVGKLKGLRSS